MSPRDTELWELSADISILGQFCTYLQLGEKSILNTFIVTNANDCPNLLSHGATFRMGVLLPNYPEENVVKGENVPNFKINTSTGTSSNVFQILQDLRLKQYKHQYSSSTMPTVLGKVHCTVPRQYDDPYHSHTMPTVSDKAHCTTPYPYKGQYNSSTVPIDTKNTMIMVQSAAQLTTSFRTTTPSTATTGRTTTKRVNPVQVHQETPRKALLEHCMHVHQPTIQVCKPGE